MLNVKELALVMVLAFLAPAVGAQAIKIAVDAEFGIPSSTSAQAIHSGAMVAAKEINAAGGVLGRKLEIIQRDNRGLPARATNNLRELAADPDVVAVMSGKYSPLVVEMLPEIHRLKMPYLVPWAASDTITNHVNSPSYVFRLSLRDSWAIQAMMRHANKRELQRVGLLLANTEWGRSNLRAAENFVARSSEQKMVAIEWYNWGDKSLLVPYRNLLAAGADVVILVANEVEGALLINELSVLPITQRVPIIAHWGITGGRFFEMAQDALAATDLTVVQTFSFINNGNAKSQTLVTGLHALSGNSEVRKIAAPVGVAHAYDLVHLLALAIKRAGTTQRNAIRSALENLGPYRGVVRHYPRPFTPDRHDALGPENIMMGRYARDGAIEPLPPTKH